MVLEELGKRVHFTGIGGARLSALATLLMAREYVVTGTDASESPFTMKLRAEGASIQIGHDPARVAGAEWLVYTNAVGESNPELLAARQAGLPVLEGSELLGLLMGDASCGVAIAGTHGKTTTTAMVSLAAISAGLDPTVVIGGAVDALNGNARPGGNDYFIAEACEFRESFRHLKPRVSVITNIDWDHPDCFPTLESVTDAFRRFVGRMPADGRLILYGDDPHAASLGAEYSGQVLTYGREAGNTIRALEIKPLSNLGQEFSWSLNDRETGRITLAVPGVHNVLNSLACLAVCHTLGIPEQVSAEVLAGFKGVHRRFEIKGEAGGVTVVDDYAHHPAAVRTTLKTARAHFGGRIWCVFQPHLYSRTRHLMPEFARSFEGADQVVLTEIYAAREADPGDISAAVLADAAREYHPAVHSYGNLDDALERLLPQLKPGDLVITMGAGDVTTLGPRLLEALE